MVKQPTKYEGRYFKFYELVRYIEFKYKIKIRDYAGLFNRRPKTEMNYFECGSQKQQIGMTHDQVMRIANGEYPFLDFWSYLKNGPFKNVDFKKEQIILFDLCHLSGITWVDEIYTLFAEEFGYTTIQIQVMEFNKR